MRKLYTSLRFPIFALLIGGVLFALAACDSGGSGMTGKEEVVDVSIEGVVVDATGNDALLAKSGQPSQITARSQDESASNDAADSGAGDRDAAKRPPNNSPANTSGDYAPTIRKGEDTRDSFQTQDQLVRPLQKDGVPIEGAEVKVYDPESDEALASATTKSDGSYTLNFNVNAGNTPSELWLEVQAEQFSSYEDTLDFGPSITYDIALEELGPNAPEISGTVKDFESQTPVDGATVTGYAEESDNGNRLFRTETNASGEWSSQFAVSGTEPNEIIVESQADGYSLEQRSIVFTEEMSVDLSLVDKNDESISELDGDSSEQITNATEDFSASFEVSEDEISNMEEGSGKSIVRTVFEIAFFPDQSVQEVNRLLRDYNARIVDMLPNRPYLTVQIPDPGSIEELKDLIENLEAEEEVKGVREGKMAGTDAIPGHVDLTNGEGRYIWHHLAVRAPAAWNLRGAIQAKPWITVADMFGDGVPDNRFAGEFPEGDDFQESLDVTPDFFLPDRHGYHVLGIMNAAYGSKPKATGIFPSQARIRAVDLGEFVESGVIFSITENMLIRRIKNISSIGNNKVVVNTSIHSLFDATKKGGSRWYKKVNPKNAPSLEDDFVHFTSAGNAEGGEDLPAYENSPWNYAALGPNMDRNLENTFVVENRLIDKKNEDLDTWEPGCLSNRSYRGGSLSAIGTGVFSIGGDDFLDGQEGTSFASGTSMSAPQAAGTAAYMLAVNPSLEVGEVVDLIEQTAREGSDTAINDGDCHSEDPAPSIDTYDAVLAAGGDDARVALLDVTEDDRFDANDIEVLLNEWSDRDGSRDYSRYDLNGNGLTAGGTTGRFDLNQDVDFGTVTRTIEGKKQDFNESALTDREILCYYAYSNLYAGDTDKRSELLPSCGDSSTATLEDLHSTNRLITSEGADGEVFDATESELDYYYRDDSDGSDIHICLGDDTIVKGRLSDISTDVNSSGNPVRTQEIVDADGVVLYDEENEGGTTTLEYLEIGTDVGETTRFEVEESDQSDIEGNTDTVRGIEEIPETDEDCANREDFHN